MKKIKPTNYTNVKDLLCGWIDKEKYLLHYIMLKFYVRLGTIGDKIQETFSFKQSKWLE